MNTDRESIFVSPTPSGYLRELSQRVKRLEFLRTDASAHRDRVRLSLIDRQIKNTILEWCDWYVLGNDIRVQRA
jgi:hypothetical protein